MNKIIAVVGMCGSGKSIISSELESFGFQKVYFGGVTMEKLKEKGLPDTPENEKIMRESLRKEYGMGAFAILLLPKIKELYQNGNVVLDGVYSFSEVEILKEEFKDDFIIVSLVVDKELRYQRLEERKVRPYTKEEAEKRDLAEIKNIEKAGPIAYADYYISGNGSMEDLKIQLRNILERVIE